MEEEEFFEEVGDDAVLFYHAEDELNAAVLVADSHGDVIILIENIPERAAKRLIEFVADEFHFVEKKWNPEKLEQG